MILTLILSLREDLGTLILVTHSNIHTLDISRWPLSTSFTDIPNILLPTLLFQSFSSTFISPAYFRKLHSTIDELLRFL